MASSASITEGPGEEIQAVVFHLGEEDLAFEINGVREIIKIPEITKIPNSSDFVEGVINLRGQIKTVFNLKKKLGMKKGKAQKEGRIIIAEKNELSFGVIVDSVVGVFKVKSEDITAPSMIVDSVVGVFKVKSEDITAPSTVLGDEKSDYLKGIGRLDDRLVILLDPEKLFSVEELAPS
jgi:purine-binding chemotaxis protein CheW